MSFWEADERIGVSGSDSKEGISSYLEHNPGFCMVIMDENDSIITTILSGHDGRRGFIYHLYVADEHRNNGLGKLLTDNACEKLKDAGIDKVYIHIYQNNTDGQKFREKSGFSKRDDLLPMAKIL